MRGQYQLKTGYFSGVSGELHLSVYHPTKQAGSSWVIHVPAFAEEMNKSRALVSTQARQLATLGMTVVVADLFGTGDSEGDFSGADWSVWKKDLVAIADWARERGAKHLTLWGQRLGCILAAELAVELPLPPDKLVFWQPIHSGKQQMTQFLRLRIAASMTSTSGESATLSQLRELLSGGDAVEVAGYSLPSQLYLQIERRLLKEIALPSSLHVDVLEVAESSEAEVSRPTQDLVSHWKNTGGPFAKCVVTKGDRFWATQERGSAPDLVDATAESFLDSVSAILAEDSVADVDQQNQLQSGLRPISRAGVHSVTFMCGNAQLVGLIHASSKPAETAVLIIVGGPQYRVGSHRQFVLLARTLAAAGIPAMRFDYRGMGDSEGEFSGFTDINQDIRSAADTLLLQLPAVRKVILWGLCDAATAALSYSNTDDRVEALVLANPWVFSEQGSAKAYLKYYYISRFLSRSFWSKVLSGTFSIKDSASSVFTLIRRAVSSQVDDSQSMADSGLTATIGADLVKEFAGSLLQFKGPVMVVLSGNDLTAAEFLDASQANPELRQALESPGIQIEHLVGIDHTFARAAWRQQAEELTVTFSIAQCEQ